MPLALDPKKKFPVVLNSDKEIPEDKRPTFYFRYAASSHWQDMADQHDKLKVKKNTGPEIIDQVLTLIAGKLVGWENMFDPETGKIIPFDKAKLKNIVTMHEAWELFYKSLEQGMDVDDLKKSVSPSDSNTESFAKPATVRRRVKKKKTSQK